MTKIPSRLKKEQFRFVLVGRKKKYPFESEWTSENNYRYSDEKLKKHLHDNGNYGVVCGYGDLTVIDCDKDEIEHVVENNLPETFKVRTGSGGAHFYYMGGNFDGPIRLTEGGAQGDIGDVQHKGKQVVGPGSIHPSGNDYKVERDVKIAEVSEDQVRTVLSQWIDTDEDELQEEEHELKQTHGADIGELDITEDVVSLAGLNKNGDEYQGSHPVHGSSTGKNFCVNTDKNTWYCFRHDTGGGAFSLLAVIEGVISCQDAVSGALEGEKFKEVLDIAEDEYGLDVDRAPKIKDEMFERLREQVEDDKRASWDFPTKFVVFTTEIEELDIAWGDTYEVEKELADELISQQLAAEGIWKCRECSEYHYQAEEPYACKDCGNEKFDPKHPSKHHKVADVLDNLYYFAVPRNSISNTRPGSIHLYQDGVYFDEGVMGFIRERVKMMKHTSTQQFQKKVIDHLSLMNAIKEDKFGGDPYKLVIKNGVLDLKDKYIEEHSPDMYALNKINTSYNPADKHGCPKWKEFLKEVVPKEKDRKMLQECLGTALVTDKLHKKGMMLVGPSDAGKSTLLEIIKSVLGEDNCSSEKPSALAGTRWATMSLRRALLNTTDEVKSTKLSNLDIIKQVMDGNEITAERKNQDPFDFHPTCEHLFCANQTPDASRKDDAFWNRWIVIEMPNVVPDDVEGKDEKDPDLPAKILEERNGILEWMMEGLDRFIANNKIFTQEMSWEEARRAWLNWGSSIQRFIERKVFKDDENKIAASDLHDLYSQFAKEHDMDVESQHALTKEIKSLDYANYGTGRQIDGKSQTGFLNVGVKGVDESDNIDDEGRVNDQDSSKNRLDNFDSSDDGLKDEIFEFFKSNPKIWSEEELAEELDEDIDDISKACSELNREDKIYAFQDVAWEINWDAVKDM